MRAIARLRSSRMRKPEGYIGVSQPTSGSVSATLHRIRQNLAACVKQRMPSIEAELDS